MADSDIRDNTSETSKLNESLLSSIKATEDLRREIDTLNKQKVEPAQAQARLSATAGPTLSPAEEMRRAVQTAIRQSAQATAVRPPNPLPSKPTETARPPQAMSPTSTTIRPPQPTQPTRTTITTPQQQVRAVPIETPRKQEPSSNLSSPQHNQSKVEVLQPTPKDSTRQEAASQRSNMGKGAASGWAWVGEHGKELVHFQGGETVLSHDKSVDKADKGLSSLPGYASGTPNPSPPPPNPHPLDPAIAELHKRLDLLEQLQARGVNPATIAGHAARESVAEQEKFVRGKYLGLSPADKATAEPALEALEKRRQRIIDDEIEQRRRLNNELTRGQYAVAEFAANLTRGDVGGALGALAGGMGGAKGVLSAVVVHTIRDIFERRQQFMQESRAGAALVSPSAAQTADVNEQLRIMAQGKREGAVEELKAKAMLEHRRKEAEEAGISPYANPRAWQAYVPFSPFRGAAQRAKGQEEAAPWYVWMTGSATPKQERVRMESDIKYYEEYLKQKGRRPTPLPIDIPNIGTAGVTTSLGYQTQLQVSGLQRNDATNEKLQEQLRMLAEMNALLTEVKDNTANLRNTHHQWQ